MANGFTRQETISLTGITSGRLSYLDRKQIVVPEKDGNPSHPRVVYSWEQVLQIKIIARLREKLSLQEIRSVIDFLKKRNYEPSLFDCQLVLIESKLYLIEDWREFGTKILEASGKNKGKVVVNEIGVIGKIASQIRNEAKKNRVLDFDKRIIGTPLAAKS